MDNIQVDNKVYYEMSKILKALTLSKDPKSKLYTTLMHTKN